MCDGVCARDVLGVREVFVQPARIHPRRNLAPNCVQSTTTPLTHWLHLGVPQGLLKRRLAQMTLGYKLATASGGKQLQPYSSMHACIFSQAQACLTTLSLYRCKLPALPCAQRHWSLPCHLPTSPQKQRPELVIPAIIAAWFGRPKLHTRHAASRHHDHLWHHHLGHHLWPPRGATAHVWRHATREAHGVLWSHDHGPRRHHARAPRHKHHRACSDRQEGQRMSRTPMQSYVH